MPEKKFNVTGMTCSACSAHVEKSVRKVAGVEDVAVNLLKNSMTVRYDDKKTNDAQIEKAVRDAGYDAFPVQKERGGGEKSAPQAADPAQEEQKRVKARLIVSIIFTVPLFYIAMGHMFSWPLPDFFHGHENALTFAFSQFLLILPVVAANNRYYRVGFKMLYKRSPNMDSLIAIGSAAAVVYGVFAIFRIGYGLGHMDMDLVSRYSMDLYFESAAVILTLITLGKYLEARAKGRTSDAIRKLIDLAPKTALVVRDGAELEIPVEDVVKGDLVVVKPGQSVPVDGVLISGGSFVDESALTGESIPAEKKPGDTVIGASINKAGAFTFEARKVGDDTTLAQIIRLVDEASSSKAPISKLADRISGVFVPIVILIAVAAAATWLILGYPFEFAFSIGIAVLVISCPCALGLATPTAIMVGTGKGAENGILIKSAEALEICHKTDTVVLDKTGTITEGKPRVTDIVAAPGISEEELLRTAASVEKSSEHPLAAAVMEEAEERGLSPAPISGFSALPGLGVEAELEGRRVYAGNARLMADRKIPMEDFAPVFDRLSEEGKTPLYFADGSRLLGVIGVADVVKPTSKGAIEAFLSMGLDVVMLTGDNRRTAEAIRRELGITRAVAEVLPQDKEREIRALQSAGKKVAMIGDGINDAPSLALADVGIVMGAAGTHVAIDAADVTLMNDDLMRVVEFVQMSRKVLRRIKLNIFFSIIYNVIGLTLAMLGHLSPVVAVIFQEAGCVTVVLSSTLLLWAKVPQRVPSPNTYSARPSVEAPAEAA